MNIIFALFLLPCLVFAAPQFQISKFKDDKAAAVSLTFDDGTRDHLYKAVPLLEKYGFKGTFYIIIKRVAKNKKSPDDLRENLTWEEIRELHKAGHEIGNHSLSHRRQLTKEKSMDDVRNEINAPIPIFREKLGIDVETFCYPGSSSNKDIESAVLEKHLGASRWRYPCGGTKFSIAKWREYLDKSIKYKNDFAALIHAIVPETKGYMPFENIEQFEAMLQEIKKRENKLWVAPYAEVVKYKLARDNAELKLITADGNTLEYELKYNFPKKLNTPLTLKYAGYEILSVSQNSKNIPLKQDKNNLLFSVCNGKFTVNLKSEVKNVKNNIQE